MVKRLNALKRAAREDKQAAEAAKDALDIKNAKSTIVASDGAPVKKKRKARPAALRRQRRQQRAQEALDLAKAKRDEAEEDDEGYMDKRIFVANLPLTTTRKELRELFERFGEVHTAKLVVNSHGEFRGVGFVTFVKPEEFEEAVKVNGMEFNKQILRVEKATPPPPKVSSEVYIAGIPFKTDEKEIRKHFRTCGLIKQVRIIEDWQKKKPNGTAFITFKEKESAKKALELNASTLGDRTIFVGQAHPKLKKKQLDRKRAEEVSEVKALPSGGAVMVKKALTATAGSEAKASTAKAGSDKKALAAAAGSDAKASAATAGSGAKPEKATEAKDEQAAGAAGGDNGAAAGIKKAKGKKRKAKEAVAAADKAPEGAKEVKPGSDDGGAAGKPKPKKKRKVKA